MYSQYASNLVHFQPKKCRSALTTAIFAVLISASEDGRSLRLLGCLYHFTRVWLLHVSR